MELVVDADASVTLGRILLCLRSLSGDVFAEIFAERTWTVARLVTELATMKPLPSARRYRLVLAELALSAQDLISAHVIGDVADLTVCIDSVGQISAGEYFTVALSDGIVKQYGKRHQDGTGTCSSEPPEAQPTEIESIACGYRYSIALFANGSISLWGSGDDGVANIPDFDGRRVVFVGHCLSLNRTGHAMVILEDGSVACWGDNSCAQCEVPSFPQGRKAVQVAGGQKHSLALLDDGTLHMWGCTGGPPDLGDMRAVAIDAAYERSLALLDDGSVICFGYLKAQEDTTRIRELMGGRRASQISAGCHNVIVLLMDGDVVSIGHRESQMLNLKDLGGTKVVGVAAGEWHCALLLEDGRVVGWGDSHGAYEDL